MGERDPYLVIMRAAAERKGVRLSASEVAELSSDDAVAQVAINSLTSAELERIERGPARTGWTGIRVHRHAPTKEQP